MTQWGPYSTCTYSDLDHRRENLKLGNSELIRSVAGLIVLLSREREKEREREREITLLWNVNKCLQRGEEGFIFITLRYLWRGKGLLVDYPKMFPYTKVYTKLSILHFAVNTFAKRISNVHKNEIFMENCLPTTVTLSL